jgi:outer membrane protein assembly factor BamA
MTGVRVDVFCTSVLRVLALCLALAPAMRADAQGVFGPPPVNRLPSTGPTMTTGPRLDSEPAATASASRSGGVGSYSQVNSPELVDTAIDPLIEQNVVEIRVIGNESRATALILSSISTRVDRPFDQALLEKDVRTLAQKKWFLDVRPIREQVQGGVRVTFEVIERPTLLYVKYLGNSKIKDKRLAKETDLKKGSSLDPYAVEEGRRKIEEYYQSKGYNDVRVQVLEGTKPGDRGAIFMINEGEAQKIRKTTFVGNTVATDQRLKTQIESKPPLLGLFKGQYSQQKVDEDIDKLISYYRNLGFFRARVSREVIMDSKWKRPQLNFVIDEGPRYKVRAVSYIGNRKFTNEQLGTGMVMKEGAYFLRREMDQDITRLQDVYGTQGYVFANVQQELRFEEEPGELTVVFSIEEGSRYAVGKINVHISGENPHTRFNAVLNRLMFRPGDVVNTQKIRNAERRLKASSLFVNDPSKGQIPKITFTPPGEDEETGVAERPSGGGGGGGGGRGGRIRGQSPDNAPAAKKLDMHVFIDLNPSAPAGPDEARATSEATIRCYHPPAGSSGDFVLLEPDAPLPTGPAPPKPSEWWSQCRGAMPAADHSVPAWWPLKPNAVSAGPQQAPVQEMPRRLPAQSSTELPPLDIAADEVLIVRGQGPGDGMGQLAPQYVAPLNPVPQTTTSPKAAPPQRSAQFNSQSSAPAGGTFPSVSAPAQNSNVTVLSPNLTAPVSLSQSLATARSKPAPTINFAQTGPGSAPTSAQPAAPSSSNRAAAGASSTPAASTGTSARSAASVAPYDGWIVRGQSQYGGRLLQPLSPGPQSAPISSSGPTITSFGGNSAAFQSPASSMAPPQFTEPLPGMPTDPTAVEGEQPEQLPQLPIMVNTEETQTGRFMFGVGVNSNAGLVGSIVIDEQNFDWRRPPTNIESWRNGTAWRGGGQHFRIELAPGTQMSRYLISFNNPYLWDTNVNYGMSGYYYQRFFYDWYEQRLGGRVSLGYQFRPDLTGTVALKAEDVIIKDPRIAIPDLVQVQGSNGLFSIQFACTNDTRDNTFFPTDGRYINVAYEQATGSFTYPRVTLDLRKYITLTQRPDGSGRQVLALYSYTGVTGANTPIYDRFFMGGIGTMRGFYFRDASPTFDTVVVGGDFQSYGTIEYTVPVTADDMFRLAAFVDGGFDSRTSRVEGSDIRISPGLGVRISVPAMGPAPISVDFAVPVVQNPNDQKQLVNFSVGVAR